MARHNSKEPLATIPASIENQNIIIGHNSDEISELLHQGNRIYRVCYATNLLNAFGGINKIKIHIGSKHIIAPATLLDLQSLPSALCTHGICRYQEFHTNI